jgi:hypothetical protein
MSRFASTRVIESPHALVPPALPISDDMRSMVDDLERFGQIRQKPGAYSLADGTLIVHPVLFLELRRRLSKDIERKHEELFFGALMGKLP